MIELEKQLFRVPRSTGVLCSMLLLAAAMHALSCDSYTRSHGISQSFLRREQEERESACVCVCVCECSGRLDAAAHLTAAPANPFLISPAWVAKWAKGTVVPLRR